MKNRKSSTLVNGATEDDCQLVKSILCVTDNFLFASACVIFLLGKFLGKPNNFSNQPGCRMSVKCCDGNSLRGSSDKIGTILC